MSRNLAASLALLACSVAVKRAAADDVKIATLLVHRAESAADCPDAARLAAAIEQTLGARVVDTSGRAHTKLTLQVSLSSGNAGYVAILRARGTRSGERRIDDIGATCAGLQDALTVTLALILDDERRERAEKPEGLISRRPTIGAQRPPRRSAWLFVGAGASVGVMDAMSPMLGFGMDVRLEPLILGAGLAWLPEQSRDFSPGRIHVSLLAGYARACYPFVGVAGPMVAALCAHLTAGSLRGRGDGYTPDREAARAWVSPGTGLSASGPLIGALLWNFESFVLFPIHEERFTVDGIGVVNDPAPVALLLQAGFRWSLW
jgi:hypothetical protein